MAWATDYINFEIFVPYFFGSDQFPMLTLVYSALFIIGSMKYVDNKSSIFRVVILAALIGFAVGQFVTRFYSPLFHVRNLLVVGFVVVIFIAEAVYWLISRGYRIATIFLLVGGMNIFSVLLYEPIRLSIDTFEWRYHINRYEPLESGQIYIIDDYWLAGEFPEFENWTIEDTLNGLDTINGVKHKYLKGNPDQDKCVLILHPLWKCRL